MAWLIICVASSASAQIRGTVVTDNGTPLSGALVELWSGPQLRVARTTGPDGAFALNDTARAVAAARSVTVRKIGFRPLTILIEAEPGRLRVTLSALPTSLAKIDVRAKATYIDPCARKPSTEAARLFARAAEYYRRDTPWLDKFVEFSTRIWIASADERDSVTELPSRENYHRRLGEPGDASTARAFPAPQARIDSSHKQVGWLNPRFEWTDAPEFVLAAFVDSMPRSIAAKRRDGFVVSFCPRERREPYTSGEIELAADTTIVAIRWKFTAPKPHREAGGVAFFSAPESRHAKAHLLPMTSVSWTRIPDTDRYEAVEYSYGRWLVSRRDSISLRVYADSIHRVRRP